jgi:hypothetical protein
MGDASVRRYCAMGGFAFVVLGLIGTAIAGSPPAANDPPREILEYFKDSEAAIRLASYLSVLGIFFLLFWLGNLWATLRRAEGGAPLLTVVAGLGAVLGAAGAGTSFAVTSMIALRHGSIGEGGAAVFYELSFTLLGASGVGVAALVLATSLIVLQTSVFPRWIGGGGLVITVAWLIAASAIATDKEFVGLFGLISFVLWAIWILAISVVMLRDPEPAAA